MNVGGDHTTHINNGVGSEKYAALESIEQRLRVVQDKELGKSGSACALTFHFDYAYLDNEVGDWLGAPDVSQNFNAALLKRQAGTGTWFLDAAELTEWK